MIGPFKQASSIGSDSTLMSSPQVETMIGALARLKLNQPRHDWPLSWTEFRV